MTTRIASLITPPIAFAHRGARAHAEENTVEAFALAQQMGATGIETDAWRTADGEIVLVHDGLRPRFSFLPAVWFLGRPISSLARSSLPASVPTLAEYYQSCGTGLQLSVDVKDSDAFDAMMSVARAHGASQLLWACHHDLAVLTGWRRECRDVRLVHSTRLDRLKHGPERHAADLTAAGIDAVNLRATTGTRDW